MKALSNQMVADRLMSGKGGSDLQSDHGEIMHQQYIHDPDFLLFAKPNVSSNYYDQEMPKLHQVESLSASAVTADSDVVRDLVTSVVDVLEWSSYVKYIHLTQRTVSSSASNSSLLLSPMEMLATSLLTVLCSEILTNLSFILEQRFRPVLQEVIPLLIPFVIPFEIVVINTLLIHLCFSVYANSSKPQPQVPKQISLLH
jgi:hypothetical protein